MKVPKLISIKNNIHAAIFETLFRALSFSAKQIISTAKKAIKERGSFHFCISGAYQAAQVYDTLCTHKKYLQYKGEYTIEELKEVDWSKVHIYFCDERNVAPSSNVSNHNLAMKAGLGTLGIPSAQIHRMNAENNLKSNAAKYEALLTTSLPDGMFDLTVLALGHDGHVASLFPETAAVSNESSLVAPNYVPQIDSHRMTLTFKAINSSRNISIYAFSYNSLEALKKLVTGIVDKKIPASLVGNKETPVLFISQEFTGEEILSN